jgi:hypothetical protein
MDIVAKDFKLSDNCQKNSFDFKFWCYKSIKFLFLNINRYNYNNMKITKGIKV